MYDLLTSPYMSIHFHQGKPLSSFGQQCVSSSVRLHSVDSVTYECNDISESFPPPTALSFLSRSFSTPIASSGLYKLAMSTESETPALTWPPGGNASPDTRRFYSQSSGSDLQICTFFAELDLTSGKKAARFHFTGPLMVINEH